MIKAFLSSGLLVVAVGFAGCGSSANSGPDPSNGQGGQLGASGPGASLPTSSAPAAPLANTATTEQLKHDTKESPATPSENPNRVFQLADLKKIDLKAAGQTVHAWIMDSADKREEGMMFLTDKDVKENEAMIFVFPSIQGKDNSFWMHNCPLGLDIVYIGKNKKVINVGDGKPQNDNPVKALGAYSYVLELKRGWSKRHGLIAGAAISIPDTLKTSS